MAVSTPPTSTNILRASAVPLGNLITILQQLVGRPVVDKTGLTGLFDFRLQFSPDGLSSSGVLSGTANPQSTPSDPVPSLFTAIQELGLRLESAKGPVDVLVVDSVQKPTAN
jgi:uncharacterized protein (TIGR03435 family)